MKFQQGDVIIKKCDIPKDAKKVIKRAIALGEVTGHSHKIIEDCEMYERDGVLYIKSTNAMNVKHEEHGDIILPAGKYKVDIVKEYDPFLEEVRQVRD